MPYIIAGIIPIGGDLKLKDQYPLVQSRCHYNVVDVYTVATVVQEYYSDCSIKRDVEYVFPLPPSAAVCTFKAVLDDNKVIKGVVKEKGEAESEYNQAVAQGRTAGLLQQEHADVFRVSLGNIKPKQRISVHISFVSIVPHDGSSPQTLRITMPTVIAPRYGTPPTNIPWFGKNSRNRFELTVAVQMSKPVTSVSSPSHPIGLTLGCAQKELQGDFEPSKAFIYLGDSAFLDKDIVIVISAQGLDTPRCTVERWLSSDGAEETTDAYAITLVPKFDLPALPSQEYIFLVDRSGSMAMGRMDAVKTSLQIMLKSLPSRNTTFNIISFGSRFTSLWPTSQAYSAESVEEASRHVDSFLSNYGGTELRSALEFAFSSRAAHGKTTAAEKVPASVFILTDGEAWDLRGVLDTVTNRIDEAKRNDSLLRTFVLGVGNQVSTAMCEGIARAGKGTATFVAEGEKPDSKLMGLLKAARGAVIEDLAVDWSIESDVQTSLDSDDEFEMISTPTKKTPAPAAEPPISLFDDSTPAASTDLGPQKAIINLLPPPVIQQAPKSDKLPIPLYPGFRCSIFAIIKQSANPGPHPPNVKITGKVLGRDVVLQLPVTPIDIASDTTEDAVEGGRLLHTLAAKALIQDWEDKSTTPGTKAEIERLGKRYTLASSVTSFLAIDEDTNKEPESSPEPEEFDTEVVELVDGGNIFVDARLKRKRQSASCDACRSRKVRCARNNPEDQTTRCTHCISLGVPCTYDYQPKKRGPPNLYLRRLQEAAAQNQRVSAPGGFIYNVLSVPSMNSYGVSPHPLSHFSTLSNSQPSNSANSFGIQPHSRFYNSYSGTLPMYTGVLPAALPNAYGASLPPSVEARSSTHDAIELASGSDDSYRDSSIEPSFDAFVDYGPTATFLPPESIHIRSRASISQPTGVSLHAQQPIQTVQQHRQMQMMMAQQQQLGSARGAFSSQVSQQVQMQVAQQQMRMRMQMSRQQVQLQMAPQLIGGGPVGMGLYQPDIARDDRSREKMRKEGSSGAPVAATFMGPLSIEGLARAQTFDGSFPSTQQFISFLSIKGGQTPALPSALSTLVGDETVKASIWVTILTLACLQKKFSGEKDAWEMLAEKGKDFVQGALLDLGVGDDGDVQRMIGDLTVAAIATF